MVTHPRLEAAYDPCRPIHYVVRPLNATEGADEKIEEAVAGCHGPPDLFSSTTATPQRLRPQTYVTGQVRLNAAALGTMSRQRGGNRSVTAIVKHELAHVVGLGHVGDSTQLMAASASVEVSDFSAGDLTGLAMLGSGKCRPEV